MGKYAGWSFEPSARAHTRCFKLGTFIAEGLETAKRLITRFRSETQGQALRTLSALPHPPPPTLNSDLSLPPFLSLSFFQSNYNMVYLHLVNNNVHPSFSTVYFSHFLSLFAHLCNRVKIWMEESNLWIEKDGSRENAKEGEPESSQQSRISGGWKEWAAISSGSS